MSTTNDVRQVLMNELGLTREFIKQEATRLIEQTVAQHVKNLQHQGVIKEMVESEFRRVIKGSDSYSSIQAMCRHAIQESVKQYIDGHLTVKFSGFDAPIEGKTPAA